MSNQMLGKEEKTSNIGNSFEGETHYFKKQVPLEDEDLL
jgi:hypothetical protein